MFIILRRPIKSHSCWEQLGLFKFDTHEEALAMVRATADDVSTDEYAIAEVIETLTPVVTVEIVREELGK